MQSSSPRLVVAAVVVSLALAGCRSNPPKTSPGAVGAQGLLAGIAKAKADSARLPYTEADIHFMSGMIGHHAQAIVMSRLAPNRGASASVLTLAARIINAQEDEIALMQQWLRERRQPVPEARAAPMKMVMNGMMHEMLMPGMLSDAQMKALEAANGMEFDRLFLVFMIQHHQGALSMVKDLFNSHGAGQDETVFKFASDVNVDQTTEVARMQRMLFTIEVEKRTP